MQETNFYTYQRAKTFDEIYKKKNTEMIRIICIYIHHSWNVGNIN